MLTYGEVSSAGVIMRKGRIQAVPACALPEKNSLHYVIGVFQVEKWMPGPEPRSEKRPCRDRAGQAILWDASAPMTSPAEVAMAPAGWPRDGAACPPPRNSTADPREVTELPVYFGMMLFANKLTRQIAVSGVFFPSSFSPPYKQHRCFGNHEG